MVGPLGQVVFEVPKLGETGFKIDQTYAAQEAARRKALEKKPTVANAEKEYYASIDKLKGVYRQSVQMQFDNVFRPAAIDYYQTGSQGDLSRMEAAAAQLNDMITQGTAILENAGDTYRKGKDNGFEGFTENPLEASQSYTDWVNRTGDVVFKDGKVMIRDGEGYIPALSSTYYGTEINPNNAFMYTPKADLGKYVNPENFVKEQSVAISKSSTLQDAIDRVILMYNKRFANASDVEFANDVLGSYLISDDGLAQDVAPDDLPDLPENRNKIAADKYLGLISQFTDDEEVTESSRLFYEEKLRELVTTRYKEPTADEEKNRPTANWAEKNLLDFEGAKAQLRGRTMQYVNSNVNLVRYVSLPENLRKSIVARLGNNQPAFKGRIIGMGVDTNGDLVIHKEISSGDPAVGFASLGGAQYAMTFDKITRQDWASMTRDMQDVFTREFSRGRDYQGVDPGVETLVRATYDIEDILGIN